MKDEKILIIGGTGALGKTLIRRYQDDNKIMVFTKKDNSYENNLYYTAQINSRKDDWSDNLQIITIKNKKLPLKL